MKKYKNIIKVKYEKPCALVRKHNVQSQISQIRCCKISISITIENIKILMVVKFELLQRSD